MRQTAKYSWLRTRVAILAIAAGMIIPLTNVTAAEVARAKLVKAGGWRTLESGWNATFPCRFRDPAGAEVKVRYGGCWIFGWNRQRTTLDGTSDKTLQLSRASLVYGRVQMKVQRDTEVKYTYIPK